MTTTVTITGTGCPIPDAERAGPGVLVDVDGLRLQFDAGRSTVQRLAGAGLPTPRSMQSSSRIITAITSPGCRTSS